MLDNILSDTILFDVYLCVCVVCVLFLDIHYGIFNGYIICIIFEYAKNLLVYLATIHFVGQLALHFNMHYSFYN